MLRPRNPAQIQQDAINMAIKKANQGCLGCTKNYFELARRYGATEEEISQTIHRSSVNSGISRRTLLKIAMGVAAGLTVGSAALFPAKAEADSLFWGTDTNTESCCGMSQDFYMGHLGAGIATGDTSNFNTSAAVTAGVNSTYGYWDVEGPDSANGTDPYSWGFQQGQTAGSEWINNPNAYYIGGGTIFGDIEGGNPGWGGDQSANQAVLQGFLDGIGNSNLTPGVYITPDNWQSFFGSSYAPNQGFVLWLTGAETCVVNCAPCASCTDTPSQVQSLLPSIGQNFLGNSGPVLWQYWIGGCGCGDYNVAMQDPSQGFTPITSQLASTGITV